MITLCSLPYWAFAQTGTGGELNSFGPAVIQPPSNFRVQTAPGIIRPNNVNPNNPNSPLNPVNPNIPNNPANPNNPFYPNNPNYPNYRHNTNYGFGNGRGMTNGFGSSNGVTNGFGSGSGGANDFGIRGFTNAGLGYAFTNMDNSYSTNSNSTHRNPYAVNPWVMGGSGSVTNR